jgi:glucosamine--fructose-6-phosphate aminotransferase (isomerizing)
MCGIVGILGRHEVAPLILESLKRLEYRGYDSAELDTDCGGDESETHSDPNVHPGAGE